MSDIIKQLKVVQALADEKSVRQLCDILIDYITKAEKKPLGFTTKK